MGKMSCNLAKRSALNVSKIFVLTVSVGLLVNCVGPFSSGGVSVEKIKTSESKVLSEGSVVISRNIPARSFLSVDGALARAGAATGLGFVPAVLGVSGGTRMILHTAGGKVGLFEDSREVAMGKAEGIEKITPGVYRVVHKQRNPLWYAPDSYFVSRKLPVPAAGTKGRFLKGALGDFALFLDKDIPIHAGPMWTPDVGGIKIDESALSKIYYQLPIGGEVLVQ